MIHQTKSDDFAFRMNNRLTAAGYSVIHTFVNGLHTITFKTN